VNDQPVGSRTRFGLLPWRAPRVGGEAQMTLSAQVTGVPRFQAVARGKSEGTKLRLAFGTAVGGWRRDGRKVWYCEGGRPVRDQTVFITAQRHVAAHGRRRSPRNGAKSRRAGVRAPITATKPGNAGGAKGCRKVDAE
jgi:hypothetical protein